VAHFIDRTYASGIATFTLGLIVTRLMIDEKPEQWLYGEPLVEPAPLWKTRPTVLHSAERLTDPGAKARWKEQVARIDRQLDNYAPNILWIEEDDRNSPEEIRSKAQKTKATCYGLVFIPHEFGHDLQRDPLVALCAAGAPYVLWTSVAPADWASLRSTVQRLVRRGPFHDMPARMHDARAMLDPDCKEIRLIWDHPSVLPKFGALPGLATGD